MDSSAYLPFWLLGIPVILAIFDRMTMGGGTSAATRPDRPMGSQAL